MSVAQQGKRVRKRLAKTRPPKGKSGRAQAASNAIRARLATKKK